MASSSKCVATPTAQLNDGYTMPMVGLGTFQDTHDSSDKLTEMVAGAVKSAIDIGYRHIDTASVYVTEQGVGQAIKEKIQEGVIQREDVFVTTKLWNTDHRRVVSALRRSLSLLQLDYVDMYLVHWPMAWQESDSIVPMDENGDIIMNNESDIADVWKNMEECRKLGLTRSIGVCNFNHLQLQRVLDICTIKPANNQIEIHPFLANKKLVEFCESEGIVVTAYCPLCNHKRPEAQPDEPSIATNHVISRIAKQKKKTGWQVSLRFLTQRGIVVIPRSVHPQRQMQNLDIFDFNLIKEDLEAMYDCNLNFRIIVNKEHSPEWPFHEEW